MKWSAVPNAGQYDTSPNSALADDNDLHGKTFAQIAQIIRDNF